VGFVANPASLFPFIVGFVANPGRGRHSVPIKSAGQNRGGRHHVFPCGFCLRPTGQQPASPATAPNGAIATPRSGPQPAVSINYALRQSVRDYSLESLPVTQEYISIVPAVPF
jgi:hypothetical protein